MIVKSSKSSSTTYRTIQLFDRSRSLKCKDNDNGVSYYRNSRENDNLKKKPYKSRRRLNR